MKVYELFEDDDPHLTSTIPFVDPADIADELKSNCSEMIAAFKSSGVVLARGIKEQGEYRKDGQAALVVRAKIRHDRSPVFMDPERHEFISTAMNELNLPTRKNSLFCTTRSHIAQSWGPTYILFVKNGWKGLVFDGVDREDYAFADLNAAASGIDRATDLKTSEARLEAMKDEINLLRPKVFSTSTELAKVLQERYSDILITGDSYYGLLADDQGTFDILDLLDIDPRNIRPPSDD